MQVVDREALLQRARTRGVNPLLYWIVRAILQPFFHVYWRLSRIGREHIPASGPVILASNHRSFLDPFVIAVMARRPIYFMAKKELFVNRPISWLLSSLGAFPIDRGASDRGAMDTARAILDRGDGVLLFPEGTRIRPGALGRPKRGIGRLALETGAPVVPIAVIGTEAVRRGWRFRPHKVRIRAGRALTFPRVERPTPSLAGAVTDRIWPCIELQWEWLGGTPKLRRAAVIGAGAWGTSLSVALARAGLEVDLGTRTAEQAMTVRDARVNERYLPGVALPDRVRVQRAADLELAHHDLVCFAVPARELPAAIAAHGGRIPARAGILVLSTGLVPPLATLPSAYVAQRTGARAVACLGGPGRAVHELGRGASLVAASTDAAFLAQVADVLKAAGFDVQRTSDVTGVELAATAKDAAVLAAAAAAGAGPGAAGAAAGRVFAEVDAYARRRGGRPETFAGLAGTGGLVAGVIAGEDGNRRAGELLAAGVPSADIPPAIGRPAEALDALPLLAAALREDGVEAPAVAGLAAVVEGRVEPEHWAVAVAQPTRARRMTAA
ncbi:MAG: glycerol-3-phosphate dehydrogenase [Solirubrobacteraceae bacterium]|jgi:1-acyl-sn-glycerol-3-phosphate acyltransferase|nr:glycerol-3-phosphate dehydrogenase [Solirubrobacteraceae bacterium]